MESLLDEEAISGFIVEALENLSLASGYEQFKNNFHQFLPNLILDVGLNLVKTMESER